MTRARGAIASAVRRLPEFPRFNRAPVAGHARIFVHPAYARLVRSEPYVKRLIPLLIVLFVVALGVHARRGALPGSRGRRGECPSASFPDRQVGRHRHLRRDGRPGPAEPSDEWLQGELENALSHRRHGGGPFDLRRRSGRPDRRRWRPASRKRSAATSTRSSVATQPLTTLGERAGVLTITSDSGEDLIATVHHGADGRGSVAVVQSTSAVFARLAPQRFARGDGVRRDQPRSRHPRLRISRAGRAGRTRPTSSMARRRTACTWRSAAAIRACGIGTSRGARSSGRRRCSRSSASIRATASCRSARSPSSSTPRTPISWRSPTASSARDPASSTANSACATQDGRWVWIRARAEVVCDADDDPHLVGIAVDVTEQKRLGEASRTADIRLRDAIEAISEAFVLWDSGNRLVMCNSKYQQLYGLPDDLVRPGTPYDEILRGGARPITANSPVLLSMPSGPGSRSVEAQLDDGRWLQINERRTKDGGFVSVGTDITALKNQQEQLLRERARPHGHRRRSPSLAPAAREAGPAARRARREICRREGQGRGRQPVEVRIPRQCLP